MNNFSCPACGAEIKFQSSISVFAVCPYCRSMLVRQNMNLTALGKMAELQDDASPLQIGTRGNYKGDPFTLVGRVRQNWGDGFWDEWNALFFSGRQGWLAEAQGYYMVSFEMASQSPLPTFESLKIGSEISLETGSFIVDDINNIVCEFSEGELPFAAPNGQKAVSVDLTGDNKIFANLVYSEAGTQFYKGEYIEFDHLQFSDLRTIDGW